MIIEIRPLDTLFFRDGKPFGMGEETWSGSSVLPNPSVVWGALFSMLLSRGLVKQSDEHRLQIKKFFLYDQINAAGSVYLPVPLDIYEERKSKSVEKYFSKLETAENVVSNYPLPQLLSPNTAKQVESLTDAFMDIRDFYGDYYLEGTPTVVYMGAIYEKDYKIGIGRNKNSKSTEEGLLYRIELMELHPEWRFWVEMEFAGDFPSEGIVKLGGEGKTASFRIMPEAATKDIKNLNIGLQNKFRDNKDGCFKLYFSSPTFFSDGCGLQTLGNHFEVSAAIIGRPKSIGGFDVHKNEPKAMLKALPPGTVYYLKNTSGLTYEETQKTVAGTFPKELNSKGYNAFEILPLKNS